MNRICMTKGLTGHILPQVKYWEHVRTAWHDLTKPLTLSLLFYPKAGKIWTWSLLLGSPVYSRKAQQEKMPRVAFSPCLIGLQGQECGSSLWFVTNAHVPSKKWWPLPADSWLLHAVFDFRSFLFLSRLLHIWTSKMWLQKITAFHIYVLLC